MLIRVLEFAKKLPEPVSSVAVLFSDIVSSFGKIAAGSLVVGILLGLLSSSLLLWKGYYPSFAGTLFVNENDYNNAQLAIEANSERIHSLEKKINDGAGSSVSGITPMHPNGDVIIDYKGRVTFTWTDSKKDQSNYTIVVRQRLGNEDQSAMVKEFPYSKDGGTASWTVNFQDQKMPFGEYVWTVKPENTDSDDSMYRFFSVYPSAINKIKTLHTVVVGTSLIPDQLFFERDKGGDINGYEPKLVDLITQQLSNITGHIDVKFRYLNWDDLLPKLASHEIDLVVSSMTKTKARELSASVRFSTGYYTTHQRFVVRRENDQCLAGEHIGVVGGQPPTTNQLAAELLQHRYRFIEVRPFVSAVELFRALDSGEIDAALVDDITAERNYSDNDPVEFFGPNLDDALSSVGFYGRNIGYAKEEFAVGVSSESADLLSIVDEVLVKARSNGTLENLSHALALGGLKRTSSHRFC